MTCQDVPTGGALFTSVLFTEALDATASEKDSGASEGKLISAVPKAMATIAIKVQRLRRFFMVLSPKWIKVALRPGWSSLPVSIKRVSTTGK